MAAAATIKPTNKELSKVKTKLWATIKTRIMVIRVCSPSPFNYSSCRGADTDTKRTRFHREEDWTHHGPRHEREDHGWCAGHVREGHWVRLLSIISFFGPYIRRRDHHNGNLILCCLLASLWMPSTRTDEVFFFAGKLSIPSGRTRACDGRNLVSGV